MNIRKQLGCMAVLASLTILTACSRALEFDDNGGGASATPVGESAPGAMLAYTHDIRIELPAAQILERLSAAREACATARFGECHILKIKQGGYASSLTVRVLPAGVEPLITLAGEAGKITSRNTSAEDLTEAVKDNQQKQAHLDAYAKRMDELSQRADIKVSDLIELAREQASVQQQREALLQESAQQQRRIDTNLLTIDFFEANASSPWRHLFDDLLDRQLAGGIGDALKLLAYGLPFLLLFFPVALLWRWVWRRVTGRGKKAAPQIVEEVS
jgi:hypothetical protein